MHGEILIRSIEQRLGKTRHTRQTRRQSTSAKPFHRITAIKYVRFVGYIWSFFPGVGPLFAPDMTKYLPVDFEEAPKSAPLVHLQVNALIEQPSMPH